MAGLLGTGLTAFVRDYWILLGLTMTATALAGSLFPQTFAYARQVLERDSPGRAAMGISTMRTIFSLAWVAGPLLGLSAHFGYRLAYGLATELCAAECPGVGRGGSFERLLSMGATVHGKPIERGTGFVTASVVDPFGNILGARHLVSATTIIARHPMRRTAPPNIG